MKKLIVLALFLFLVIFLISTCPDKQHHRSRLAGDITHIVSQELGSADALTNTPEFQTVIGELAEAAVDVDNYVLFSIGKLNLSGNEQIVSFGIAGHVFTFNDKIVKQVSSEYQKIVNKLK